MILRLTARLAKKIGEPGLPAVAASEEPYGDWTARLFTAARYQYVLISHTTTLYSAVTYGAGVNDLDRLMKNGFNAVHDVMREDGKSLIYQNFVAPKMGSVQLARALNKQVTGSMNDLVKESVYALGEQDCVPIAVGAQLNKVPLSMLDYQSPGEAFRQLDS